VAALVAGSRVFQKLKKIKTPRIYNYVAIEIANNIDMRSSGGVVFSSFFSYCKHTSSSAWDPVAVDDHPR
jgi:hypothetical protein